MDFLNQAFLQIKEIYDELTPGSRVIALLLTGVLLASIGYLFMQSVPTSQDEYLFDRQEFSSAEIRNMEAAFADAELNGHEIVGGKIRVPKGQKDKYVAALSAGNALPKDFGDILRDAAMRDSAWATKEQREQAIKEATQRELASIISNIRDIESAAVNYDEEEMPGLRRQKSYSAAVDVVMAGNGELDKDLVTSIVHTLTGAIAGLTPEKVNVIDMNNGRTFRGNDEGVIDGGGTSYTARKESEERLWKSKVQELLDHIRGVKVITAVELNPEISRAETTIEHDPRTTAISMREESTSLEREGAPQVARPGYESQGNQPRPMLGQNGTVPGEKESQSTDNLDQVNAIAGTRSETIYAGLTPKKVTASIVIPSNYILQAYLEKFPLADGETAPGLQDSKVEAFKNDLFLEYKQLVANALPDVQSIVNKEELVEVALYQSFAAQPIAQASLTAGVTQWLAANWSTIGLFGLVGFSLLIMWSVIRERPPIVEEDSEEDRELEEQLMTKEQIAQTVEEQVAAREEEIKRQLAGFNSRQMSLKEEVSTMVNDSPDAAANVLRQWIGNIAPNS